MFAALHTPVKRATKNLIELDSQKSPPRTEQAGPSQPGDELTQTSNVRQSVGEWELVRKRRSTSQQPKSPTPPRKAAPVALPRPKPSTLSSQEGKLAVRRLPIGVPGSPPKPEKFPNRTAEAKACLIKAKTNLELSRNLKTDIKSNVLQAIDRLFELVKESEGKKAQEKTQSAEQKSSQRDYEKNHNNPTPRREDDEFLRRLDEHDNLIKENIEKMAGLTTTLENHKKSLEASTYASVASAPFRRQTTEHTTLHSVVVTARDETETGEEVLSRLRKAVNAREGGVTVEKIRKAKDRKVIVGFKTEEERQKVKDRIEASGEHLIVEDIKNKDPLVILRDVLQYNKDEEIFEMLRNQNKGIFQDLDKKHDKMEIAYKRRTRNPHASHVVMRVSPIIWQRMTEAEAVRIDLQRIKVADQSPLVQCSLCLGYGHGRRFCKETLEKCSHCGGPHLKTQCADWLAGETAACCNCSHAKMEKVDHNAFSMECPIRRKWDALARTTVAYC